MTILDKPSNDEKLEMDSRKVNGYIFWLSEYIARNSETTVHPKEIEFIATDANEIINKLKNDDLYVDDEIYETFLVNISDGIYSDYDFIPLESTKDKNIYLASNIYIDLSKDTDLLVSHFGVIVEEWKRMANINPFENFSQQVYGQDSRYTEESYILKYLKKYKSLGSYEIKSDNARTSGIWLWDFVKENRCSIAAAVRQIKKQPFIRDLGFENSPERALERHYAKTRECIEQKKMLPMSDVTDKK